MVSDRMAPELTVVVSVVVGIGLPGAGRWIGGSPTATGTDADGLPSGLGEVARRGGRLSQGHSQQSQSARFLGRFSLRQGSLGLLGQGAVKVLVLEQVQPAPGRSPGCYRPGKLPRSGPGIGLYNRRARSMGRYW